ncbi:MAG: HEAT repeat domain-containing protein, partial [Planctomycetaceae bacterium]
MESLIEQLKDPDPDVRGAAIETAVGLGDESLIEQLETLVLNMDTTPDGRESAVRVLARVKSPRGIRFLTDLFASEDATIRGLSALGMSQQQTPQAVSFLIAALNDPVNTVRNIAERSLLSIIDCVRKFGISELLSLLEHKEPLTRSPAARVLGA